MYRTGGSKISFIQTVFFCFVSKISDIDELICWLRCNKNINNINNNNYYFINRNKILSSADNKAELECFVVVLHIRSLRRDTSFAVTRLNIGEHCCNSTS